MKIIKIESCYECPNCKNTDRISLKGANYCVLMGHIISPDKLFEIYELCPLDDLLEKSEGG